MGFSQNWQDKERAKNLTKYRNIAQLTLRGNSPALPFRGIGTQSKIATTLHKLSLILVLFLALSRFT